MADYIVLEEDGTSLLELEESADGFVLEESGGATATKAGGGVAGAAGQEVGAVPTPGAGTWKVGYVTVPGSTGTQAVTGLGGTPKAVFFFGTNFTTEDAGITTDHTGVFRGMAAPTYNNPSVIINSSASVVPAGDANHISGAPNNFCMNMLDLSGNLAFAYLARVDSFDADGFTLNWLGVALSGRKVVYVALMEANDCGAFYSTGNSTVSLGWKAGAMMLHGSMNGPDSGDATLTKEYYGSAAYPGTGSGGWFGAGLSAYTFPGPSQYNIGVFNQAPTTVVTQGGGFVGPFLAASDVIAFPTGVGLTDFRVDPQAVNNGGATVVWDDEDNQTGRLTPATTTGGTVTVTGLPFEPGLVIGYSIGDEPPGQGAGARGAAGFSVATADFQWTALVDGASSRGSFQSFQRGVCDAASGTTVHTGTIQLTTDGFVVTTAEDDVAPATWVWHAFGHPDRVFTWIPRLYRRGPRG
jgi:hypothetical protein